MKRTTCSQTVEITGLNPDDPSMVFQSMEIAPPPPHDDYCALHRDEPTRKIAWYKDEGICVITYPTGVTWRFWKKPTLQDVMHYKSGWYVRFFPDGSVIAKTDGRTYWWGPDIQQEVDAATTYEACSICYDPYACDDFDDPRSSYDGGYDSY